MTGVRPILVLVTLLVAAASVAGVVEHARSSTASYTTSSESSVTASADTTSGWLNVFSETTDPQGQIDYARRRDVNGVPGVLAATGLDGSLAVDLGDFPDKNATFAFARVFSIRTPDDFPDPSVGQVTVTVTMLPDPTTGDNMLQTPSLTPFGQTKGGAQTVTLPPATKYQFNVSVKARRKFTLGQTYFPRVRLSLTVGGLAGYYSYEFPLQVRDAGGN